LMKTESRKIVLRGKKPKVEEKKLNNYSIFNIELHQDGIDCCKK